MNPLLLYLLCLTAAMLCITLRGYAQKIAKGGFYGTHPAKRAIKINDSTYLFFAGYNSACKLNNAAFRIEQLEQATPVASGGHNDPATAQPVAHGNITYDYFYRSLIDTPFTGSNVQQHNIRANVQFMLNKQLPVLLTVNSRQTNSPFFKNYTDVSLQFDNHYYNSTAKEKMLASIVEQISNQSKSVLLLQSLNEQDRLQAGSKDWLENPRQLQQLAESRQILAQAEQVNLQDELTSRLGDSIKNRIPGSGAGIAGVSKENGFATLGRFASTNKDVLTQTITDSLATRHEKADAFLALYKKRTAQYESNKKKIDSLQQQYNTAYANTQTKIAEVKSVFAGGNNKAITEKIKTYGLDSSRTYKLFKRLNAIKKSSLGRSMVDYSELSAKNISINGVQVVYQEKIYLAIASGAVDYRYRDFMTASYTQPKQWLNLARAGVGAVNENNLVLTVFQGKKQANYFTGNQAAVNKIFGLTLQGKFLLAKNTFMVAEVAKSNFANPLGQGKVLDFSNHSNEALSVQLFSRTGRNTNIYGQYKYLGRNFQSFSTFNTNSDSKAWQARIDQYFFKRKLFITAGLRTNDFDNPYTTTSVQSTTVFKTLQATLRIKKWPAFSIGYMPTSQLTRVGAELLENRFYTFTASSAYTYRTRRGYVNEGVVYSKFYNQSPDSGFVYYNAKNIFVYHNIIGNRFSFNSFLTLSYSSAYQLITVDEGMNIHIGKQASAGGGIKFNRLNNIENHIGYYGSVQFRITRLGEFNFSFDRGFIPGAAQDLRKNDFGRATYIKTF